ncbi:MAG: ABC transporter permease, partial [Anaerolinea sp.]|nr:ABC transporter permease [Anaerolinea sp.]
MNLAQALIEALRSLTVNKLRSALTILGIVIGVAAVIAMISLGRGLQASVSEQLSGVGSTTLVVFSAPDPGIRFPKPLTMGDVRALSDPLQAPDVLAVAAQTIGSATFSFGSKTQTQNFYGVTANYFSINNLKLAEGEALKEEHILGQSAVVVLGPRLAKSLFGRQTGLVGEMVHIEGQPFRVIGVLKPAGNSISFTDTDNAALLPISLVHARSVRSPRDTVDFVTVQVRSAGRVKQATEQVRQVLRVRHQTPVGMNDVNVFVPQDMLNAINQIMVALTVFLGGIAAISLLVGGIGIMNIMLVSVTERTREIGLRKALGARRGDILLQFLAEAATLSLMGGVLGIVLGWLIGVVFGYFAKASGTTLVPQIGLDAVLIATLFSSAIGLFFG